MTAYELKTCIHGVQENLDYHPCEKCAMIAILFGWKVVPRVTTYIFTEEWLEENCKGVLEKWTSITS